MSGPQVRAHTHGHADVDVGHWRGGAAAPHRQRPAALARCHHWASGQAVLLGLTPCPHLPEADVPGWGQGVGQALGDMWHQLVATLWSWHQALGCSRGSGSARHGLSHGLQARVCGGGGGGTVIPDGPLVKYLLLDQQLRTLWAQAPRFGERAALGWQQQ